MGIKITTDDRPVKVHRSDRLGFPTYAVRIGKKEGDHWVSYYQDVMFRKGIELENGTLIFINKAFPTPISWVNDTGQHVKLGWMVLDFTVDMTNYVYDYESWEDMP